LTYFVSFFSQLSSKNFMAAKTPTQGSPPSGHKAPFPQRFSKKPHTAGSSGPHPGELLPYKHPTGDAKMALADFFQLMIFKR
jgi:hypothetical protein